jgi:hypothetical protein
MVQFKKSFLAISFVVFAFSNAGAQSDIPLGTWRLHLSYNSIHSIAFSNEQVFGASSGGILIVNRGDNSIETINRLNGLSSSGITHIANDNNNQQLLVAYEDGVLDIIGDEIVNFDRLKNSTTVTGSKKINHINIRNNLAFLSADYGVVVFDLLTKDLRETWRNIGPMGSTLKIHDSAIVGDSIFLATDNGVIAGNLNTNLLDFNLWKRFNTGVFSGPVQSVEIFNGFVYTAINGDGIYRKQGGSWIKQNVFPGRSITEITASAESLLAISNNDIMRIDLQGASSVVVHPNNSPQVAFENNGVIWIGDLTNGLLSNANGNFSSVPFNGPASDSVFRLKYDFGKIVLLPGPANNANMVSVFQNGLWSELLAVPAFASDYAASTTSEFFASWGNGIQFRSDDTMTTFDASNSPLETDGSVKTIVSALEPSSQGIWIANYGATRPLHLFADGEFTSFSFPFTSARYPTDLVVDYGGNVWMSLDPIRGGGVLVFNPSNNQSALKTEAVGSGALPNNDVNAIVLDRDGYVWIGSDEGVSYFYSPQSDVVNPLYENRFLMRSEKITALAVDGGNRKWVGTERGAWLFTPSGEALVYNFTEENSPLISNKIIDIEVNQLTGEVFFATDRGIISYRSDATSSNNDSFQKIKIFPNPVTSQFSGAVGIEGLATDAVVKITDISGKLIWETKANGGTATWNVRDYNGHRAETGIYLVFAATEDGGESVVGKIAVVD